MKIEVERFKEKAREGLANESQREVLARLPVLFKGLRDYAFSTLPDARTALDTGAAIRRDAVARMPELLARFEENAVKNGVTVLWANDYADAKRIVLDLAKERGVDTITKGKSMLSDEMGLNEELIASGIDTFETDLGEFIVQQAERPPFHIVGPAVNMPVDEIADLFVKVMGVERTTDLNELTIQARSFLREKFLSAQMGITGVNMAVAETGTMVLVENEGNIRYSTSAPKTHVAIMGIEKVIPTMNEALHMLRLLTRSCTGQAISTYVSFINGPKRTGDIDGPDEVFLVIVDAGRSRIYADPEFREVLQCIKCGSCLNSCPVWTKVGGYAYGWVYSGPIGAVLNPLLLGQERTKDLYFATSLCGTCTSVCPAGIDHPKLFLKLRERRARGDKTFGGKKPHFIERLTTSVWSWGLENDGRYRLGSRLFRLAVKPFVADGKLTTLPGPGRGFTEIRNLPEPPKKTFRDRWRDAVESKNGR